MKSSARKTDQGEHRSSVSVHIDGDVSGPVNVAGRDLRISESTDPRALSEAFTVILERLEAIKTAGPEDIADARAEVKEIQEKIAQAEPVDEGWLAQRFRNLARMGPDILDVVTATLVNPAAGAALVVRQIAERARADHRLPSNHQAAS